MKSTIILKLLSILFCIYLIYSCNTGRLVTQEKVWQEMTVKEFIENNPTANMIYMKDNVTVYEVKYSKYKHGFYANDFVDQKKFYYFQNNKLFQIDTGQLRQQRYQIEMINR
jgi:hypothetical protein